MIGMLGEIERGEARHADQGVVVRSQPRPRSPDTVTDESFPVMLARLGDSDASAFLSEYFSSHPYRLALHHLPDLISLYDWGNDTDPALLALLSPILLAILRFPRQSFIVIKLFPEHGFHFLLFGLLPRFQSLEMLSELVNVCP
jgi:hypothetical protein